MKLLLDMGIPPRIAASLREKGCDAVHLREQALGRLKDSEVLRKAVAEGRVLVTHDLGFGDLMAASGGRLPSVITLRLRDMRAENVARRLEPVLENHEEALRRGAMVTVTDSTVRIRPLPVT